MTPAALAPSRDMLHPAPARPCRLLAIASGKGGVGKTWLAITLSHALARARRRVLLFDADLGLANVDIQLGLTPTTDLAAVVAGQSRLEDAVLPHEGGFDILPGRSGSGALSAVGATTLERVLDGLQRLRTRYDDILLDLGAGVEPGVRLLAARADLLLVVATEDPTSLTDAYAVLKLHAADTQGAGQACIAVNQAATRAGGERVYATLARACTAFLGRAPALAGIVRRDAHVQEAIRRQALLLTRHPSCPAAADAEALAAALG